MEANTPAPVQPPNPAVPVNTPIQQPETNIQTSNVEPSQKLPVIWIIFAGIVVITLALLGGYYFMQNNKQEPSPSPSPSPLPSLEPKPIICKDAVCLLPLFLGCAPSELTMPFVDSNSFVIKVFGKVDGLCHYSSTVSDKNGSAVLESSDCRVPLEKITKNTFGHFFGEDKKPGQEAVKAEQDKLENDYCVKKTTAPSPVATKITCSENDQGCIFTNVINNFTNNCQPAEVIVTSGSVSSPVVTFTISAGQNNSCRFQMVGLGVNQNCLFSKENVTAQVAKGMLGMDNIPNNPDFQKIKAASCK